jgi:hypothetical protein
MAHYPDTILVIADILQNIRPARVKNANPYDEDYEAVKPLNQFGERHHAGVLALHHTRKAKAEDVFDEISGSTGLAAGVAGMWVLGRMPNSQESILAIRGRDIVIDDDLALEWDDYACRFTWTGSAEERSMTQERRAILDSMDDTSAYTPKEIASLLGRPVNNIKQLLLHLFNDRYLEKAGHGKYVKVLGMQTYGLIVKGDHDDHDDHFGNDGHVDNDPGIDPSKDTEKVIKVIDRLEGDHFHTMRPKASNIDSDQSDRNSTESGISHDQRREREVMEAIGRHDYRAARRIAGYLQGRKNSDRVNQFIDEAEHGTTNEGA